MERRIFDEWAETYDQSVLSSDGFPFSGYEAVLDGVVVATGAEPRDHVLDLGVGTGNLAVRFAQLGCRVSGIDYSARMLALARKKVPTARLVEADMRGPWPPDFRGPFDRIVSAYALHHLDLTGKIQLLQELAGTWLSVGGRIVVGDICFPTPQSLLDAKAQQGDRWDESESYWVASETISACTKVGLRVHHRQVSECGAVLVFELAGQP
jgi:putative AdoMet-dependent methyltransferase